MKSRNRLNSTGDMTFFLAPKLLLGSALVCEAPVRQSAGAKGAVGAAVEAELRRDVGAEAGLARSPACTVLAHGPASTVLAHGPASTCPVRHHLGPVRHHLGPVHRRLGASARGQEMPREAF